MLLLTKHNHYINKFSIDTNTFKFLDVQSDAKNRWCCAPFLKEQFNIWIGLKCIHQETEFTRDL